MFDHVTIRASDREASERFYLTVLPTLGIELTHSGEFGPEWNDFSLAQADAENPPTRRLHIGFVAPSRAHVDEFWRVGTEAGYTDDGAPGPRPQYSDDYYGAFLLDPDGNSAEAVHHGTEREGGNDRPSLDPRRRPRGVDAVLRDGRARRQGSERARVPGPDAVRLRQRLVLGRRRNGARPSTSTSPSPRPTTRRSTGSTARRSRRATATTALPASERSTTRATTARSCSTRTGTTSRW